MTKELLASYDKIANLLHKSSIGFGYVPEQLIGRCFRCSFERDNLDKENPGTSQHILYGTILGIHYDGEDDVLRIQISNQEFKNYVILNILIGADRCSISLAIASETNPSGFEYDRVPCTFKLA